jgi:hypothetical protein
MELGAYITIITAIIAAFLTYRNQLRLKAFELFLARRDSVLKDIEQHIERLYIIENELESGIEDTTYKRYKQDFFRGGLVLYHKIKGANFGEPSSALVETFFSIIHEPIGNMPDLNPQDWVYRTLNILTALYGFAHSQTTKEIESMSFSFFGKLKAKYIISKNAKKK